MCYSTHDCTFIQQSDYRYNRKPHQTLPVNWNNPPHNFSTSVLSCLSIIQCCLIIRWTNQLHEHNWTFVSSCQISDIFSPFLVTLSVIWYYIVLQSAITATVRLQALGDLYRDSFSHTHLQIHNQLKYKLIMIYLWTNCLYISYTYFFNGAIHGCVHKYNTKSYCLSDHRGVLEFRYYRRMCVWTKCVLGTCFNVLCFSFFFCQR